MDNSSSKIINGQAPPTLPAPDTSASVLTALAVSYAHSSSLSTQPHGSSIKSEERAGERPPLGARPLRQPYHVPLNVPTVEASEPSARAAMAVSPVTAVKAEDGPRFKSSRFVPAVANASAYYLLDDNQGKADSLRRAELALWYPPSSQAAERLNGGVRLKRRVDGYIAHAHVFAERVIDSDAPGIAMLNGVEKETELSRYLPELAAVTRALDAPDLIFGPELEAMRAAWESMGVHWSKLGLLQYANTRAPNGMHWRDFYNLFIERIRQQARTPKYKAALRLRAQQASRRKKRTDRLVDSSFKRRGRICVVRVDLGYLKQHHHELSSEQVRAHLARLQANRRHKRLFLHLVAAVVRLEYASSFHFHVALLFDGHEVQRHAYYGDQVIDYWKTTVTKGMGHGHNCSRDEERYRKARVPFVCGMTNWDDKERIAQLKGVLHYLAKQDQYVAAKLLQRERTFWTTVIKSDTDKPKRGRPRGEASKDSGRPCAPSKVRQVAAPGEGA